ncbi:MAG: ATP-binding protein, partial [Chloroflexota bacterium]
QPIGALMGRVDLSVLLQPSVSSLQGTVGAGDGFIVDEEWTIIAHRRPDRLMQPWAPLKNQGETILDHRLPEGDMGYAYDAVSPSGSRQLIYYFVGLEHPWTVVIMVPFETVLRLATEVAVPLAGILLFMTVLLAAGLAFLTRRLTRPMASLAQSAVGISRGDFNTPIAVNGEDEVGQLGNAFEQMRESLQARLSELQLVLGVSRNVSSSLDLNSGLPPILDGALQVTGADGVRVVIAQDDDRNTNAFSRGSLAADMAPLDIPVARLVLREPHVRIENTARARLVLESFPNMGQVRAFAAFPIRSSLRFLGVLWIAYRRPHSFTDAEINFLSTLASQASVFVENVQLFDETERDRRRLAGILTSTQDSIVVTDIEGNIAMLNPAAENALNLSASVAKGQPAMTTFTDTGLTSLLSQHDANQASEIHLDDGRILYGRSSSILGEHDQELGRVAVLRDITDLKELDEMKTDFVSTVSHDLREPLMNMRGHVTMLPMVGEMNSKQSEYVEKIIADIDKMNELVSNLLDLAEIESGDDSELEMVDLEDTVDQVVEKYRSRAAGKGLEVDRIKAVPLPLVPGYPTLLRQAISNLVDNAIQYTSAGQVSVKTHVEGNEAIIQVSDTGTGVSQADQVRLFEKFFRVKKRDVLGGHGSGLGLAIVKSIIERRHGGRVWVKSQLGAGSTFTIALPIQSRTTGTNI